MLQTATFRIGAVQLVLILFLLPVPSTNASECTHNWASGSNSWCSDGYYCTGNDWRDGECKECTAGSYCNGREEVPCAKGTYSLTAGASACDSCGPGKYSTVLGASSSSACIDCLAGKFSDLGASSCHTCAAGKYAESGASSCTDCPAGKYYESTGARSVSTCKDCLAGKFSTALGASSSSTCQACAAGKYAESGASSCTGCPAGKYAESDGAPSCTDCTAGKYSGTVEAKYENSCSLCQAGKYSSQLGAHEASMCQTCPSNKVSGPGASVCSDKCSPGTYFSGDGAACEICPIGRFSEEEGAKSCIKCPTGRYLTTKGADSAQLCTPCERGTYSEEMGSAFCYECGPGTVTSSTGMSQCESCEEGKYQPSAGKNNCTLCERATYAVGKGSSQCLPCPKGRYGNALGARICNLCPSGTFGENTGQTECLPCDAETYANPGSTVCNKNLCSPGRFSGSLATPNELCELCEAGKSGPAGATKEDQCTPCVKGRFAPRPGSTCDLCPPGRFGNIQSSSSGDTICDACPGGTFSLKAGASGHLKDDSGIPTCCTVCPKGHYAPPGSSSCESCGPGTFQPLDGQSECVECPLGKASDMIQQTSITSCDYCSSGRYAAETGQSRCTSCVEGKYSTTQGSSSPEDCEPCPATMSSAAGSSSCSECLAGRYSAFDGDRCNKCEPGKSTQDLTGQRACTKCQAGYYQTKSGAGTCLECPANFYSIEGSANCTSCPKNSGTMNMRGATTCTLHPDTLAQTKLEQVMENFRNGIAYVVTMLICGVFGGLGFAIFQLRSKDARLVVLTAVQLGGRLALSAVSLVSEAFLLSVLFASEGFIKLGVVILVFRLLHSLPTIFILSFVFTEVGQLTGIKTVYKEMFAKDHFLQFIYPYASLALLCCFDCSLLFGMPFYFSEFANLSQGYPDMRALRLTQGYKIIQDFVRFICNVVYLSSTKPSSTNAAVDAFFIINILISLASIVLAAMVLVMKSSILMEIEEKGGTADSTAKKEGDEEKGDKEGDEIVYGENPMHSTPDENPKPAHGLHRKSLREWLSALLPSVDSPSIFAVYQAFHVDGIETFDDLVECIKGKVVDISEIKNYSRAGKLSKMDTLAIIKAVEEAVSGDGSSEGVSLQSDTRNTTSNTSTTNTNNPMLDRAMLEAMDRQTASMSRAIEAQTRAITEALRVSSSANSRSDL